LPVRLVVYPSGQEEADGMAARIAEDIRSGRRRARDIAVFYRINALSRSLEHALRAQGIPYQIVNGLEFYQRKEIKDVLAYLHLLNNPQNNLAFLRIINTPARGIGKKTIERLAQHAGRHRLSLVEAARESGLIESIPKRTAVQIAAFVAALDRMSVALGGPLYDLMKLVLDESGYRHWLEEAGSEEDLERLANIEEMLTAAEEFDRQHPEAENPLEIFLEQAALVADTDAFETESDKVTLMTLHAAKGLEFPVVYIAATEQGLLPHERSMEDEEKLEEERRLLFVGMTRARHELQLSLAQYRAFRGERRATIPSQFLMELPREEMQVSEPSSVYAEYGDSAVYEEPAYDDQGPTADVWSDDDFVQDSPEAYADRKSAEVRRAARRLKQASEELSRRVSRVFRSGMQVHHPEYGTGVILSISGSGSKRTARVRFAHEDEIRSFLLAHSPLEPLLDAD
jgi:DNA helicase-2/ATP-dependent DNA helicase PcrA